METGQTQEKSVDVPTKGIKLARRVAGLQQRNEARRHTLEVIILHDGTWLLIVNGSAHVECLGNE